MSNENRHRRPVQLHVIHSLGGGSAKWLSDYAEADPERENLVLRSFACDERAGAGLALHADPHAAQPLQVWRFAERIPAVAISHAGYREALGQIVAERGVGAILVSSLIGHSLEALDTGLPTVAVCHDYFPYCPSINLYYGEVCTACDEARIGRCHDDNLRFNPFVDFPPQARRRVRERYLELVQRPDVRMASPSRCVVDNLARLDAAFARVQFATITPGYGHPLQPIAAPEPAAGERLRVVVLGELSHAKGLDLLAAALPRLGRFAEVYLLGCGAQGERFRLSPGVHVHSRYEVAELPQHIAAINPHVGLLASIVAETFSYTLSELTMLGVPAAATRLGSFAERIEHGANGFLFDPRPDALVDLLAELDADRPRLAAVRARIRGWTPRSAEEMVRDYHRLVPLPPPPSRGADEPPQPETDRLADADALAHAATWRENKRLHVWLSALDESRDDADRRLRQEAGRLREARDALARQEALVRETRGKLEQVSGLLHARNQQLEEIYASTSWRISSPVRWAGRRTRKVKLLARCLRSGASDYRSLPANLRELGRAWRAGGSHGLKKALLALQPNESLLAAWTVYRATFEAQVRPRIAEAIRGMRERPLVSVIVPTFNTPEPMLREMLASVLGQSYPQWELCIADDGSSLPHVRRVLEEHAAREPRIKLHFGQANGGVSRASNRALELVTGDFVVLLDHDDRLEEQALYRFAACVLEDRPDIAYSDEMLVGADGRTPRELVYRPAFSPEFLRGHPYIVHLAGFRPGLLREIGGFDESLRISQDYDLMLRATEKARTVVHIPEVLYLWRVHGASEGHRKMEQVMRTSRDIVRRHMERVGEPAPVEPGPGFNMFDVRYRLDPSLRVAIVIPTRNHGRLLRQCIESLRSTVEVAHDIVVVDHESDEPETLAYLASLGAAARVIRYSGPFNFSAINNRAVASLQQAYTHVLFCNNDIEAMRPGWLERMVALAQQPGIGVVGAKLFYGDKRTIQHAGVCVGAYGRAEHYGKFLRLPEDRLEPGYLDALVVNHEVSAVTAACMLVRRDAFASVGGFDEAIAVGFGDVDLCLRISAQGYRVVFCPQAELVHHESMTRGVSEVDNHPEDTDLFRLKWKALLQAGDPYYNPGLSLTSTTWAWRQPLPCAFDLRRRIVKRAEDGRWSVRFSPSSG